MFKEVPEYILQRVVPEEAEWDDDPGEQLPWNRRSRRRHQKAKRIILHLYSGPNEKYWVEKVGGVDTEVICLDTCLHPGYNVLSDKVMVYLIKLKVVGVIGGPPCRTVSACRYNEQGTPEVETWEGPRPVRSEKYPFGLPTNTVQETEMVTNDSVLFLRQMFLYGLAEELRPDEGRPTMFALEQPEDPARTRTSRNTCRCFAQCFGRPSQRNMASGWLISIRDGWVMRGPNPQRLGMLGWTLGSWTV